MLLASIVSWVPMAKALPKKLLEMLVCPKCKGGLEYKRAANSLECRKCRLAYPVEDGIPIMLVEEAKKT
jgi:uncharacterized protein YbaR (Trm112 family)